MTHRTTWDTVPAACVRVPSPVSLAFSLLGVTVAPPSYEQRAKYIKQTFALLSIALAPVVGILKLASMISAIIDMLKAVVTLDVASMIEALEKIMKGIGAILALIPQTSVPIFILAFLQAFALLLDVIVDDLDALDAWENSITPNAYNADAILCLQQNLTTIKAAKMAEIQSFLLILGPINVMFGLIGMNEIGITGAADLTAMRVTLRRLRDVLMVLSGGA